VAGNAEVATMLGGGNQLHHFALGQAQSDLPLSAETVT
jgi:hypothetical protein